MDAEDSLALEAPRPEAAAGRRRHARRRRRPPALDEQLHRRRRARRRARRARALHALAGRRRARRPRRRARAPRRRSRTSSGCAPAAWTAPWPPRGRGRRRSSASAAATRCWARDRGRGRARPRRRWPASGCCPVPRASRPTSGCAAWPGRSRWLGGAPAAGYEIRHGEPSRQGGEAMIDDAATEGEGCAVGAVLGTSWHGLLEGDDVRRGLLAWVAARRGRRLVPRAPSPSPRSASATSTASATLIAEHVDTGGARGASSRAARRRGCPRWRAAWLVASPSPSRSFARSRRSARR